MDYGLIDFQNEYAQLSPLGRWLVRYGILFMRQMPLSLVICCFPVAVAIGTIWHILGGGFIA